MNATTAKLILEMIGSMAKPPYYGMLDESPKPRSYLDFVELVNGAPLPTFIADDTMLSKPPESATKLARAARRRGVKPHLPEEGGSWEQERDRVAMETIARLQNENAVKARAELMETAKMQLAVYCHKMSIDDAECQRIADRINYEHSEKNHLRNAKPLRSQAEVIAAAITKLGRSKAQRVIDAEKGKLGVERWRLLAIGEVCMVGDEQTRRGSGDEFFPLSEYNEGKEHMSEDLKIRRRITSPTQ